MYEQFTDRARRVMQLAEEEARRLKHEYIGTEHILLGLIKEGSGVAANVLKNLDADLKRIRREIEKIVLPGPDAEAVTMGRLPHTPRSKMVLEYSIEEARKLGHNYVGTEHILLGLLREREGIAAQVLMNLLLTSERIRQEVLMLIGHDLPARPKPSTPAATPVLPDEVRRFADEIAAEAARLNAAKELAVAGQEWERAASLRDQAANLNRALKAIDAEWPENPQSGPPSN